MGKRILLALVLMSLGTPYAWADWHHFHHHGGGGSPDPELDSCVAGFMLMMAAGAGVLVIGAPLVLFRVRRIARTLWTVPLVNLLLYLLSIYLRQYPGGFRARFYPPGLWYTTAELAGLLIVSLIIVIVFATLHWLVSKLRAAFGRVCNQVTGEENRTTGARASVLVTPTREGDPSVDRAHSAH